LGGRNVLRSGILAALLGLWPALTRAETAVQAWVQRYNGPGNGQDEASAVAVDGSNNVIVTGYSIGSDSGYDYVTIKYSSAGVPLWTNRYNGPGNSNDVAFAVAVDGSNNVVVTGYSYNGTNDDYATIRYSSTGEPLWTNRYNGPGNLNDYARALAVDGSDNVIVTGASDISGTWPPGECDYVTIKYSSAGVALWTNRYNGPGNNEDRSYAVAVDGNNNVIVAGYSIGSAGDYDFATIKYFFPLVITDAKVADSSFQMLVDNLQPGTLVIEAGTNLADWGPVFTNTTPTNVLFYTDPEAGSFPGRFYRAFQFP